MAKIYHSKAIIEKEKLMLCHILQLASDRFSNAKNQKFFINGKRQISHRHLLHLLVKFYLLIISYIYYINLFLIIFQFRVSFLWHGTFYYTCSLLSLSPYVNLLFRLLAAQKASRIRGLGGSSDFNEVYLTIPFRQNILSGGKLHLLLFNGDRLHPLRH